MPPQNTVLDLSSYGIIFDTPNRIVEPLSWAEHIPFAYFLVQLLQPKVVVELGVHSGNSYTAFCQAVETLGLPTSCYGVDTWEGDEHAGHYDDSIYQSLNGFHKKNYTQFSNLMRMTFDEAREYFSDAGVDLLHIDGLHTYDAVRHDFDTWLPKMSDRGLVLFHDIQVKERDFGVWQLWEELSNRYPSVHLRNSHGLGVLFVGSDMPDTLQSFFTAFRNSEFYATLFHKLGRSVTAEAEWVHSREALKHQNEKLLRDTEALQHRCTGLEQSLEQTRERIQTLGDEKSDYHQHNQELNQQLKQGREESNSLRQKKQAMEERINERTQHMEDMTKKLAFTQQRLESTQQKLESTEACLATKEEMLDAIRNTRIWRWSAPLRTSLKRKND